MDDWRKNCSDVGVGGWKCPCCGPKPGKEKKEWRRRTRARLKRHIRLDVELAMYETPASLEDWYDIIRSAPADQR